MCYRKHKCGGKGYLVRHHSVELQGQEKYVPRHETKFLEMTSFEGKGKEIRATVDGDQVQIIEDEDENRQQHWEEVLPYEDQANHGGISEFQDQAMVYDYNLEQVDFYETFPASWFSDTASIHAILAQERADDAGDGKPIAASSSQPQQSPAQSLPTRQRILPRAGAIRGAATKLEESILSVREEKKQTQNTTTSLTCHFWTFPMNLWLIQDLMVSILLLFIWKILWFRSWSSRCLSSFTLLFHVDLLPVRQAREENQFIRSDSLNGREEFQPIATANDDEDDPHLVRGFRM